MAAGTTEGRRGRPVPDSGVPLADWLLGANNHSDNCGRRGSHVYCCENPCEESQTVP